MNIKHHEVIETPYIDNDELKTLGFQLFLVNIRTHGDYSDRITMIYGRFYARGDELVFEYWSPISGQRMDMMGKNTLKPSMITGYIRFEVDPTGE